MKFYGKAEGIAIELIKLFREGNIAKPLANVFIKRGTGAHCESWSWSNQLITYMMGYQDAMGFQQWLKLGRTVKKGEKAFYILAPLRKNVKKEVNGKEESLSFLYGFRGIPVFGDSQTEGDPLPIHGPDKFIETLPLIELARHWGMEVKTYAGKNKPAAGFFDPTNNQIQLGVENLSTWAHEMIHKAEWMLNNCNEKEYAKNKNHAEIVAELGGCVLLHALGHESQADVGGCWQYVSNYAKRESKDVADVCCQLINRICEAVDFILTESDKLHEVDAEANQELACV